MSLISAILNRVDGIAASIERSGNGISVNPVSVSQMSASLLPGKQTQFLFSFIKESGISVGATRMGFISCSLTYSGDMNISAPYLEIAPEILWVYPDLVSTNDVYSNVTWNVN